MNRQVMRVAAGANLFAGCLLLQGCGMFGNKTDQAVTQVPGSDLPPVDVRPVEPIAVPVVAVPVDLPSVSHTTPYTVQKGDTISAVAYKYNLRWQDVVAVNPGIAPNRLRVGQVIQLPGQVDVTKAHAVPAVTPKAPKVTAPKTAAPKAAKDDAASGPAATYVVKAGDSLSVIAHKHGITTAALREANGLKGDKIVVGQKLKVPGAKSAEAAPAKAAAAVAAPKLAPPKTAAADAKKPVAAAEPAKAKAPVVAATPPPAEAAPAKTEAAPVKAEAATPTPPAPAAVDPNVQTYTVKEGEDLYAVAIRWGVSPSDLKSLNNLTGSEIKTGTVLKIPAGAQ